MINKTILSTLLCLATLYSTSVYSEDCLKLKGKIRTTFANPTLPEQPTLGTIHFRIGTDRKKCGIYGIVTATLPGTTIATDLQHQISCKDHSTFSTLDTVTRFKPLTNCVIFVEEMSTLIPGPGEYEDYEGTSVTQGTINICTNENSFTISGEVCRVAD